MTTNLESLFPGLDFSDVHKLGWRLSNHAARSEGRAWMKFSKDEEAITATGDNWREALANFRQHLCDQGILPAVEPAKPDDIRAKGWIVAVHNDYRLGGELHTFWLFTKHGRCVKGEGLTDAEALNQVREQLDRPPVPYQQNGDTQVVHRVEHMSQPVERS